MELYQNIHILYIKMCLPLPKYAIFSVPACIFPVRILHGGKRAPVGRSFLPPCRLWVRFTKTPGRTIIVLSFYFTADWPVRRPAKAGGPGKSRFWGVPAPRQSGGANRPRVQGGGLTMSDTEKLTSQAREAICALLDVANLKPGQIVVLGCSTSEVRGSKIGSDSSEEIAKAILDGILPVIRENGLYLAVQCCEHLNRALVVERACAEKYGLEEVNVRPSLHAGGAMATAATQAFDEYCMVERIAARAGIDIGDTLIGMHLRPVAVPVRFAGGKIGQANVVMARTRPKYIGGPRAQYDTNAR